MRAAAVILAAGLSTRMGASNKLTTVYAGKPLICHTVDTLIRSAVADLIVVTGHESEAIQAVLGGREVRFVRNAEHASGMGSSIARGIAAVGDADTSTHAPTDAALVCLGDMPGVSVRVIDRLLAGFTAPNSIVAPVHRGRRGHPVLFGAGHFSALRALTGHQGARSLLDGAGGELIEVETSDPGIFQDLDAPVDFER